LKAAPARCAGHETVDREHVLSIAANPIGITMKIYGTAYFPPALLTQLAILCSLLLLGPVALAAERPHILLVMVDDK